MAPDSKTLTGGPGSAGIIMHERGYSIFPRNLEELGLELIADADVDRHNPVGKPGLLKEDRDLVTIRGGPIVEVDHCGVTFRFKPNIAPPRSSSACGSSRLSAIRRARELAKFTSHDEYRLFLQARVFCRWSNSYSRQ